MVFGADGVLTVTLESGEKLFLWVDGDVLEVRTTDNNGLAAARRQEGSVHDTLRVTTWETKGEVG